MLAGAFYFDVGQTHAGALPKMPDRVQRVKRTGWSALYVLFLFALQGGSFLGGRDGGHGCWRGVWGIGEVKLDEQGDRGWQK